MFVNGDKFEGEWRDDQQHGQGMCAYACNDRYTGDILPLTECSKSRQVMLM